MLSVGDLTQYTVLFILLCKLSEANGSSLVCDRAKQYSMKNDVGKIERCPNCRVCGHGFEPSPPCGTMIGIHTQIEPCKPCENGTYSSEKGTMSCKDCKMKKCFLHQLFEGECTSRTDRTYCIDKCESGYRMNSYKTACIEDIPDVKPNKTTKPVHSVETSSVNTTKPVPSNTGTGLSTGGKLGITFTIILMLVLGIGFGLYRYCKRKHEGCPMTQQECRRPHSCICPDCSPNVSVAGDIRDEEKNDLLALPLQEQQKDNGCGGKKPKCGTENGFENISMPVNCEFQGTGSSLPETHSTSSSHSIDMPEGSSTQPIPNHNKPCELRLGDLLQSIKQRICLELNAGPIDKNFEALAGWLGFTVDEFKPFKLEKNPTAAMLDSWGMKSENTLREFLRILEKHGMTNLVDDICKQMKIDFSRSTVGQQLVGGGSTES